MEILPAGFFEDRMGKSSNRGALGCGKFGDVPFTGACLDFLLSGGGGGLSRLCAT